MPYIKQRRRGHIDPVLPMIHATGLLSNGELNYLLYAYCKRYVKPSYNNYKNYIGELRQCATEIERRILAPYEDQKIIENGDV